MVDQTADQIAKKVAATTMTTMETIRPHLLQNKPSAVEKNLSVQNEKERAQ